METLGDQLQQYIRAISDPTRGAILFELESSGELTATQLAKRLGLTANNIYHHMRILLQHGVVEPPRIVPRETYVEKYYRLKPEMEAVLHYDPDWVDRTQAEMTPQERKELLIHMCLIMAHLLRQAARRYEAMDANQLDQLSYQQQLAMLSINKASRERLGYRLTLLREVLSQEEETFPGERNNSFRTDLVLMAGLPSLWDEAGEDAEAPGETLSR